MHVIVYSRAATITRHTCEGVEGGGVYSIVITVYIVSYACERDWYTNVRVVVCHITAGVL